MEKEKQINYFIIEKLHLDENSDNLSNIYDLSVLNYIKEKKLEKKKKTKQYFNNIIKVESTKKINLKNKTQILKAVKKTILSSNIINKPSLIAIKKINVFVRIFFFILALILKIHANKGSTILNQSINNTNIPFNNTNNYINSININENYSIISFIFNNTSLFYSIRNNNIYQFAKNIKEIIAISFWLLYLYILIPKWDKINDTLYKITNYLLLCESKENNNYFYYLMKDFSVLVTKKKYYNENKKLLPNLASNDKYNYLSSNNIILYCINIINDYKCIKSISIRNFKIMPNDDYNDIKVLTIYIENNFKEKIIIYIIKILIPLIISIIINIINFKPEYELVFYFLIIILLLICEFIFMEYIQDNELNIDKFIDIYNDLLLQKNRFIYRKNKLIMYFALKNNNYTKKQIIMFIEKIINC